MPTNKNRRHANEVDNNRKHNQNENMRHKITGRDGKFVYESGSASIERKMTSRFDYEEVNESSKKDGPVYVTNINDESDYGGFSEQISEDGNQNIESDGERVSSTSGRTSVEDSETGGESGFSEQISEDGNQNIESDEERVSSTSGRTSVEDSETGGENRGL